MKDQRTESVLNSLGIKYDYQAEFPLDRLISEEQTQVRFAENRAPKREVGHYTDLLKAGAEFPPIVILKRGDVVDGNTRWGAFTKLRRVTISAYVIDSASPQVAKRISTELNSQAGRRMERAELANWLAEGNGSVSEDDARRVTGWSTRTITRVRGALQFDNRRQALGILTHYAMSDDVKAALNRITNPDAFRDLVQVADEAGLKLGRISDLVKLVNEQALTDVGAARELIGEVRVAHDDQIQERRAGLRVSTPLFQQLSMHLGWLIKQGASGLHDTNAHTGPRSQALLEEALDVMKNALERY